MSLMDLARELIPAGWVNIRLTLVAFPLSVAIAVAVAALRIMKIPVLNTVLVLYVDSIRITPLLLHLFFVFYALPFVGVTLDAWTAAVLTFAISGAAYTSEAVRAAYYAVPRTTLEAAHSLGMGPWIRIRRIIVPIASRVALPSLTNNFIEMFRASAFIALLAVPDIVLTGIYQINRYHQPVETLAIVGLFFVVCGWPATRAFRYLESRLAIPGW
jgi:cystine transport system permease protein